MNPDDPFSFFSEVMKQLQHESTIPMYFYAGTSTRKSSFKPILPDRAIIRDAYHRDHVFTPEECQVFTPEECQVGHLKSCNVASSPNP